MKKTKRKCHCQFQNIKNAMMQLSSDFRQGCYSGCDFSCGVFFVVVFWRVWFFPPLFFFFFFGRGGRGGSRIYEQSVLWHWLSLQNPFCPSFYPTPTPTPTKRHTFILNKSNNQSCCTKKTKTEVHSNKLFL